MIPIESYPFEKYEENIALNMTAPFLLCQKIIPSMKKRGQGRIVNIVSVVGLVSSVNRSAYTASKHGLAGLTKGVALELAEHGITCNGVCPGWVDTEFNTAGEYAIVAKAISGTPEDAAQALLEEKQPTKKLISPRDVAALVSFLSGENAGQITGALLSIDGGWTAR